MHLRRPPAVSSSVIPTASMADIAFLLIIFFMVTTAYSLDHTPVDLPATVEQEQSAKGAAIIAVTADGAFHFSAGETETTPVDGLEGAAARIRETTARNRFHPFTIKADRQVKYAVIDTLLERLREAGAQNITLLSQSEGRP
jgi:biopolymer transport protein ExbD